MLALVLAGGVERVPVLVVGLEHLHHHGREHEAFNEDAHWHD